MEPGLWTFFGQFGPLGLFIAYLMWRESRGDKERAGIDKERVEADKALAAALSALTVTIQHLERGMNRDG